MAPCRPAERAQNDEAPTTEWACRINGRPLLQFNYPHARRRVRAIGLNTRVLAHPCTDSKTDDMRYLGCVKESAGVDANRRTLQMRRFTAARLRRKHKDAKYPRRHNRLAERDTARCSPQTPATSSLAS